MKIITNIKRFFKSLQDKNTERNKKIQKQEIIERFNVCEKNEELYIVNGSNAIYKISNDMSTKDIIEKLIQMRKDALSYKNIKIQYRISDLYKKSLSSTE